MGGQMNGNAINVSHTHHHQSAGKNKINNTWTKYENINIWTGVHHMDFEAIFKECVHSALQCMSLNPVFSQFKELQIR
jgi:hypothetical protein